MSREINKLADLSLIRRDLDQQIAELERQREAIDGQIREVAALIAAAPLSPVVALPMSSGVQPRQLELLKIMRMQGPSGYRPLALALFGKDEEAQIKGVAAYLSHLKASGHVERVEGERGKYTLTAFGERVASEAGDHQLSAPKLLRWRLSSTGVKAK